MKRVILACLFLVGCGSSPSWETSQRNEFMTTCLQISSGAVCRCVFDGLSESYTYEEWKDGSVGAYEASEMIDQCL